MSRRTTGAMLVDGRPAGWVREGTLTGRPLVILAHGAGAPLASGFMEAVARGLLERDLAVARFHFPYMEQRVRDGGRRPPDRQPVLLETWRAMLEVAGRWRNVGPIVLAGKSLGGRMASLLLASGEVPEAKGVFYLGYPLHPSGKKDRLRDAHLPEVEVPQFFIQGSRDSLCDLDLLRPVLRRIGLSARLHVVEGGDHSLTTSRKEPLRGSSEWLDETVAFVRAVV